MLSIYVGRPKTLDNVYLTSSKDGTEYNPKMMTVFQAMNYVNYDAPDNKLLSNECEIIGNYINVLGNVLTGEERQFMKKYLHLYAGTKVSWKSTKTIRIWAIIDVTVRSYLLSMKLMTKNINNNNYAFLVQAESLLENTFISICNMTNLSKMIKSSTALIDLTSDYGNSMKNCLFMIEDLLRMTDVTRINYEDAVNIVGISLDYANGNAKIFCLLENLLARIAGLNSMELATQFASDLTKAGNGNAIRPEGKKALRS